MKTNVHADQMSRLLADMQALKLRSGLSAPQRTGLDQPASTVQTTQGESDFMQVMKSALDTANDVMQDAKAIRTAHDMGQPGVSLTQAMVASRKAEVAFTATMQVRNKLVDAYKDIMNMQI